MKLEASHTSPRAGTFFAKIAGARFQLRTFPLVLIVLFVLCFGLFINQFSLFWDDWVQTLSRHLYGSLAYFRYFYERPFSGWTHIVFSPFLGDNRLLWQIFTLSLRFGCVLAAWWLFQSVWPRYRRDATLAALLFAVYPGFTQQPISVAYHQHWLQYLLFVLSLALMVVALRAQRRRGLFLLGALICQVGQFSITEFFVGVEFVRPVLLWIVLADRDHEAGRQRTFWQRLLAVMGAWAPYLGVFAGYIVWRLFFLKLPEGSRNMPTLFVGFTEHPLDTLKTVAGFIFNDLKYQLGAVWKIVAKNISGSLLKPVALVGWGIGISVAVGLGIYLTHLTAAGDENDASRQKTALGWIAAGFFGVLVGPAPLWSNSQDIYMSIQGDAPHADRFALAGMVWASLLMIGILLLLVKSWRARALVAAVLVGVLATFQMRIGNVYRAQSVDQTSFYWELAWRAPSLQPGTALLADTILFPNQGLFATSGAINLMYPQQPNLDTVNYWVYSIRPRLAQYDTAKGPAALTTKIRLFTFSGSTAKSIVVAYDAFGANCAWVLRPGDDGYPDLPESVSKWLPSSDLSRIGREATEGYPSPLLFGPEPGHGWCYSFEKADLARQFGDWQSAAQLGDAVLEQGYRPDKAGSDSVYEWMPFLEAYARLGRWADVEGLVKEIAASHAGYNTFLCKQWQAWTAGQPSPQGGTAADQAIRDRVCK